MLHQKPTRWNHVLRHHVLQHHVLRHSGLRLLADVAAGIHAGKASPTAYRLLGAPRFDGGDVKPAGWLTPGSRSGWYRGPA